MTVANDVVRALAGAAIGPLGRLSNALERRRLGHYRADQERLRARYGVLPETPIAPWGDAVAARIEATAATFPQVRFATTSGSTAEPKRIAFPPERMRRFQRTTALAGLRAFAAGGVRRADMFVCASVKQDDSFTALAVTGRAGLPSWLRGLLEPHRYLNHPELVALAARFGPSAVRLWLLALANPPLLYATNPSTLALLLDDLTFAWPRSSAFVRGFVEGDAALPQQLLQDIAYRVGAKGAADRLVAIASASEPLPLGECVPALSGYVCWDGGYVLPYLERVRRHLPPERYRHIPMYSMSTETIETLPLADDDGALRYLPIAPDVLYELLPAAAPDDPARLLPPWDAREGEEYALVVSDPYGLLRYQSEDVFRCVGRIGPCPDLRFVRRRGLTWSFTGEKLTAEQVDLALGSLRVEEPRLGELQLTCVPTKAEPASAPGYVVVAAHPAASGAAWLRDEALQTALARRFDRALSEANAEYRDKRESKRLAAPRFALVVYEDLAAGLDARTHSDEDRALRSWESQFKLTPLTRRLYEELFPG